jgi:hypothetical protein
MPILTPALGLSFDKGSDEEMVAYETYLPKFEKLSEACNRNLVVLPRVCGLS